MSTLMAIARLAQLQPLPGLRGSQHARTHGLDDRACLLDELRVTGVDTAAQIQVVLEADADVAAVENGLRDPRHLHAADGERRPDRVWRQRVHHRQQVPRVRRHAVRDAHAELNEGGGGDEILLDHLPDEPEVAGIKHFELGLHAEVFENLCALAQVVRGRDVCSVAVAEVEAAAIQSRYVGALETLVAKVDHVPHAVFLTAKICSFGGRVLQTIVADADVAAHTAREVDDDVDLALADTLYDLAIVARLHAESPG